MGKVNWEKGEYFIYILNAFIYIRVAIFSGEEHVYVDDMKHAEQVSFY